MYNEWEQFSICMVFLFEAKFWVMLKQQTYDLFPIHLCQVNGEEL